MTKEPLIMSVRFSVILVWNRVSWKILYYFEETKLFGMTLKARAGRAPFLLRSSQGIKVSVAAISANDLGEQTLVS